MNPPATEYPDVRPADECIALLQRLDQYRSLTAASLTGLSWDLASAHPLPTTNLTIAGIVRHHSWAEDRWFQGRLLGRPMPAPWDALDADDPDHSMRLKRTDTVEGILGLYAAACERSRAALSGCASLDQAALVPSFGRGPVNARWILVHMIEETARHAGHLDLLHDALRT